MKAKKHFLNLIFWITLSILFNIYIFYSRGETCAVEYFGGYIVENVTEARQFIFVFNDFF